jgi:protein-disulfide isomerase
MHDALFENQEALEVEDIVGYAEEIGLDGERVAKEIGEHAHLPRVREDFLSGVKSGVNGTPTFFINGLRHDDAWDFETLLRALEAAAGVRSPLETRMEAR